MSWGEAKDGILAFLGMGLAAWVAVEVRTLRISLEKLMTTVHGHERRIRHLEGKHHDVG